MSYYGPASGMFGGRGGNYSSGQSAGGHYGPPNDVTERRTDPYGAPHLGRNGELGPMKGRSGVQKPIPMTSGQAGSAAGPTSAGQGGYPWLEHMKNDDQPKNTSKGNTVNDMTPEAREAHLAAKAAQKHAQRLADPEPEKLDLPIEQLTDAFYAARDVMHHAGGDSASKDKDGPRVRRREAWGGNGTTNGLPPPPSHKGPAYEEIQMTRRRLPAFARQEEIVDAIHANQIVVISGETGCGKTTQVNRSCTGRMVRELQ